MRVVHLVALHAPCHLQAVQHRIQLLQARLPLQ